MLRSGLRVRAFSVGVNEVGLRVFHAGSADEAELPREVEADCSRHIMSLGVHEDPEVAHLSDAVLGKQARARLPAYAGHPSRVGSASLLDMAPDACNDRLR